MADAVQAKLNDLYINQEDAFATLRRAIAYARALEEQHRIPPLLASGSMQSWKLKTQQQISVSRWGQLLF